MNNQQTSPVQFKLAEQIKVSGDSNFMGSGVKPSAILELEATMAGTSATSPRLSDKNSNGMPTKQNKTNKLAVSTPAIVAEVETFPVPVTIQAAPVGEKLSKEESTQLTGFETTYSENRRSWWVAMTALKSIHDLRLYRQDYSTFQDYCMGRWDFNRAHGNRWVKAVGVYQALKNAAAENSPLPVTEAQVRPLTQIPQDKWEEAWGKAVDAAVDGKITQRVVEQVATEYRIAKPAKTAKPNAAPKLTLDLGAIKELVVKLEGLLREHNNPEVITTLEAIQEALGLKAAQESTVVATQTGNSQ